MCLALVAWCSNKLATQNPTPNAITKRKGEQLLFNQHILTLWKWFTTTKDISNLAHYRNK